MIMDSFLPLNFLTNLNNDNKENIILEELLKNYEKQPMNDKDDDDLLKVISNIYFFFKKKF